MGVLSVVTVSVNPSLQCPDSMARYFKETDIDEFRECFYLYARSGQISTMDELTVIMRSLGMSPTITELKSYMRDKKGKLSFADFLEIMHNHSKRNGFPRSCWRRSAEWIQEGEDTFLPRISGIFLPSGEKS